MKKHSFENSNNFNDNNNRINDLITPNKCNDNNDN